MEKSNSYSFLDVRSFLCVDGMVNKALLVAFHFPPFKSSSGIQRTLAFSKYLPEYGWQPLVLTANPRAYELVSDDQLDDVPDDLVVRRAFALDARRHLSINGRYPEFLAIPDRWVGWWVGGLVAGFKMILQYRPKIIWSTYPIATAHLIGLALHRLTGIPFVADFRDSMTDAVYPIPGRTRNAFQAIEKKVIQRCSKAVFTTTGAAQMYRDRYPGHHEDKFNVIANGYDEELFASIKCDKRIARKPENMPLILVHSGVLYPLERDPTCFFDAVAELITEGSIHPGDVRIVLRATGHDDLYRPLLNRLGIQEVVSLEPLIGYEDALKEMLSADGLLIFQAGNCNHQIPAKIYEYLYAQKPILALTDSEGNTASVLKEAGVGLISPLGDKSAIKSALIQYLAGIRTGDLPVASDGIVRSYSRQTRTQELAALLDSLVPNNR